MSSFILTLLLNSRKVAYLCGVLTVLLKAACTTLTQRMRFSCCLQTNAATTLAI
jgi:hypothetical protein